MQAVLGAVAVWLELPGWVVAFHFVVGLLFFAAVVLTAGAAWRRTEVNATPGFARLAAWSLLVGLALVSAGAAVVAVEADHACGKEWPTCNGGFAAGGGHAQLQVAHRMLAYVVAAFAFALLVQALRRKGPRLAGSLPALAVCIQIGFGIALVVVGGDGRAHEVIGALHVAGAGTVWAALVALAALTRPTVRRAPAVALTPVAAPS
jgi:heme a synthase